MKKVMLILVLLFISCTHRETSWEIEPGIFQDEWPREYTQGAQDVISICEINMWIEGEEFIAVRVHNFVINHKTRQLDFQVDYSGAVLPREFRMALTRTKKKPRTDEPIGFIATAKGVEISWKMFDEIYEKYKNI